MPVRFVCPHCNQALRVSSRKTGSEVKCPKCARPIVVPDAAAGEAQVAARKASAEQGTADPFSEFIVYDDSELVYDSGPTDAPVTRRDVRDVDVDYSKVAVSRPILYLQGALIAVVALIGFSLGVLVGSGRSTSQPLDEEPVPCEIRGQLVYVKADGSEVPDGGSVVVVLPQDARPEEKFAVSQLRPEAPAPGENNLGVMGIQQIGGAYARTDDQGRYQVAVPKAGMYFLLFLSKGSKRPRNTQPQGEDLAQIGRYFLPADELIGTNRYGWTSERIKGDVRRDFAFEIVR